MGGTVRVCRSRLPGESQARNTDSHTWRQMDLGGGGEGKRKKSYKEKILKKKKQAKK